MLKLGEQTRRDDHVAPRLHQPPVEFLDLTKCVTNLSLQRVLAQAAVFFRDDDKRAAVVQAEAAEQRLPQGQGEVVAVFGVDLLKLQRGFGAG